MFNHLGFTVVLSLGECWLRSSPEATEALLFPSEWERIQIDLFEENTLGFRELITGLSHEWGLKEQLN